MMDSRRSGFLREKTKVKKVRAVWTTESFEEETRTVDKKTSHYLRGILNSLRFLGQYPTFVDTDATGNSKEYQAKVNYVPCTRRLLQLWEMLALILLHLDLLHNTFRSRYRFKKYDFWVASSNFGRTLAATVTCDVLLLRVHRLKELIKWMDLLPGESDESSKITKLTFKLAITCWSFVSLKTLLEFTLVNSELDLKAFGVSQWYGTRIRDCYGFYYALAWFHTALHQILMHGNLIMPIYLYLSLSSLACGKFVRFNEMLKHDSENVKSLTASAVRHYRLRFCELASVVELMDGIFSGPVMLWYSSYLMAACVEATRLFGGGVGESDTKMYSVCGIALDLVYMTSWFVAISFYAAQVTEDAHECLPLVHRMTVNQEAWNKEFYSQASLLTNQLATPQVALTGWNFFEIDRGVILTLGGALLTYVVLIIQMAPEAAAVAEEKT